MTHDIKHYHLTRGAAAEVRFNNRGAEGHTWSLVGVSASGVVNVGMGGAIEGLTGVTSAILAITYIIL